jgi:NAD(P)-dependent dehydrogenase (short-subunit alcohol dehydrogenase family)
MDVMARHRPARAGVAVVTGASAGVGRATARRLADVGYDVGILARGRVGSERAADDVRACGVRALYVPTDVADAGAVEAAADRIEAELGPIDVWINVAMTTIFAPLADITADEFERATRVTYLGQVHGTMAALRRMRERDRGVIVSVGSALAFRAIALQAPYCGAKFATRGFHDAVRVELRHAGSNVRIAQVHLPAVDTPQFGWCRSRLHRRPMPVPPIYRPELCARVIVAVARRPRRQRTVGWWNRWLIQLDKVAPGVLDHFAGSTWDGQQTDEPAGSDRDGNLYEPCDDSIDHGAHGDFGCRDRGMLEPTFVRSLPRTVAGLGRAIVARRREVAADWLTPRRS